MIRRRVAGRMAFQLFDRLCLNFHQPSQPLNLGSHVHGRILPLGEKCLAGFLPGSPQKRGEGKVNLKNCSELKGRT
jgi:hypothetical protein